MNDFQKGYAAYTWLDESKVEATADGCENPEEFKRGYWQADSKMLQLKDDQERAYFNNED